MVAFSVAASPRPAAASAPTETAEDPAALFNQAETLYREGRYEEAIEILEALVDGYPEPILRFNLGRAYESAGLVEPAMEAYRQYLEAAPDAPDRASVEARLDRLEARIPAELEPRPAAVPVEEEPPEETPPPEAPRPIIAPWIVAGVGGAALIAGGVLGGLSRARVSEAEDMETNQVRAVDAQDEARNFGRISTGALIVGGALVVAGVTWGIIATRRQRRGGVAMSMTGLRVSF
ncbi:MAG: tetratricopeptide repeat protein [Nannocystales bacterium]